MFPTSFPQTNFLRGHGLDWLFGGLQLYHAVNPHRAKPPFIQTDHFPSGEHRPPLTRMEEHQDRPALHFLACCFPDLTLDVGRKILKPPGSTTWKIVSDGLVKKSAPTSRRDPLSAQSGTRILGTWTSGPPPANE
jgi:hypothetical protein